MEKMLLLRSVRRAARLGSLRLSAANHNQIRHLSAFRAIFNPSSSAVPTAPHRAASDCKPPFAVGIGSTRFFSDDISHTPSIKDEGIYSVFKELMAINWDEIPGSVVSDAKKALSKTTDDKAGQEVLKNVFRAAEAVEEFGGILMSLKAELDDSIGLSGEDVKALPKDFVDALRTAYQRYSSYLDAFGPDETYLRKKVESELGAKMIYLKMRCSGLGAEWGKVTVLGTSGLSGSYVEQRS